MAMPSGSGVVPVIMLQSLLQLRKPIPCGFMTVERQRVDKARNAMVEEALKNNFDYLFFVDDDNPIPPDTLEKFIEDDKDIVGAPILSRNAVNGVHKLCCFYSEDIVVDGASLKLYNAVEKFRENSYMHKVDAIGTGCLLIKRKVLESLIKKYKNGIFEFGDIKFKKEVVVNGQKYDRRTMSEDAEFSERAVNEGFDIWVDDRIRPIHLTNQGFVKY
jgi:GT2 family glycosyltransferase